VFEALLCAVNITIMFKIGNKVVCIDDIGAENLVENDIYTVKACWEDGRGGALLLNEAEPNFGHVAFYPNRFRLVEDNWVEEVLENINVCKDVPVSS